jgi:glycosyltransferase involved in cell wall biosynthesis
VPTAIWKEVGGFDERYSPAYCEDSDLAFTLRSYGYRTIYQPFSAVIHHEGVTHGTDTATGVKAYQVANTRKFIEKWGDILATEHFPNGEQLFVARDRSARRKHVLIVDHYVPQFDKDAGSKTLFEYTKLFAESGFQVTFWPDNLFRDRDYVRALQALGVEVIYGTEYVDRFESWIKNNGRYIDYAFMSRASVSNKYAGHIRRFSQAKILFYGHDLHLMRLQREYSVFPSQEIEREMTSWKLLEEEMWALSDVIYYPAEDECAYVRKNYPTKAVRKFLIHFYGEDVLRRTQEQLACARPADPVLIFVGGFRHRPNGDAIVWFCNEILPKIVAKIPNVALRIVGSFPPPEVRLLAGSNVTVTGFVSDEVLGLLYQSSTVAIAPLRFGAGVKGKIIEGMRFGLPVVTTSIGMQGIDGAETFMEIEDSAEGFARATMRLLEDHGRRQALALRALDYVSKYYSRNAAIRLLAQDIVEMAEDPSATETAIRAPAA